METVRFRDLDALGHVNNAVYLTYFESARIAYWLHTTKRTGLGALDMILARAEIDFRSPLAYGESVEISVGATSLGRSSFVLEADMHERATARLVAESKKVLVHYDFAAGRSAPFLHRISQRRPPLRLGSAEPPLPHIRGGEEMPTAEVVSLKGMGFLSPMDMGERWPRSGRSGGWRRHMRLHWQLRSGRPGEGSHPCPSPAAPARWRN